MDITKFQEINAERAKRWHKGDTKAWSLLEWAGAMCGESGEAANVAKKLRRLDGNLGGNLIHENEREYLELKLADEVADSIIYGIIILSEIGVDVSEVIANKFDDKSILNNFPERAPR